MKEILNSFLQFAHTVVVSVRRVEITSDAYNIDPLWIVRPRFAELLIGCLNHFGLVALEAPTITSARHTSLYFAFLEKIKHPNPLSKSLRAKIAIVGELCKGFPVRWMYARRIGDIATLVFYAGETAIYDWFE